MNNTVGKEGAAPNDDSVPVESPRLRVMHVIDGVGFGGGAEESLVATLPLLRDRGIDSSVVCVFERPGWQDELRRQGFIVRTLPRVGRVGKVRALRRLVKRESPDIVHATLIEATLITRLATRGLRARRVDSLVNTTYDPARREAHDLSSARLTQLRAVDVLTSRWVHHFHVLTDAVAGEAVDVLGIPSRRITQIPRGRRSTTLGSPSPARRSRVRSTLGLTKAQHVVLNVGRHDPQKAKLDLVTAFEQVADRIPDAVLLIAGREGSDTARLRGAIARSRHSSRMRLLGHRDDVPDLLCAADVFVFPSLYEGFGGSLIEAMAMGCPIIGSDAPAVAEVLGRGRYGVVVPRRDVAGLAQAMIELLTDSGRRAELSERGRQHFAENYELSAVADTTALFYHRVASHAAHTSASLPRRIVRRVKSLGSRVEILGGAARPSGTSLGSSDGAGPVGYELVSAKAESGLHDLLHDSGLRIHPSARERLRTGSTFWAVRHKGRIRAGGWVTPVTSRFPIGEVCLQLRLPANSVIFFDFATALDSRNRGYYTELLRLLRSHFASHNVFIYAMRSNSPSVQGIRRAGFGHVATVGGIRGGLSRRFDIGPPP